MKISELNVGQGSVNVEGKVKSKSEPRVFNKYGKDLKVATAVLADSSGEISLSLWNADVDKIKAGDDLRITNGYVSEFNGTKQLTSGKFGKIEIIGDNSEENTAKSSKKAEKIEEEEVAF